MTTQCEILEREEQPTLSIRTETSIEALSSALGQAYGAIGQYLGAQGEYPAGPPFAAYYNMDMQAMDIEIGFPVAKPLPGKDNIQPSTIPAGEYASCIYTGSYENIEQAYNALTAFIQEKGREASGVAYELYLKDPNDTPPEALQTQILFLLKS